jgi:hypothetical protein
MKKQGSCRKTRSAKRTSWSIKPTADERIVCAPAQSAHVETDESRSRNTLVRSDRFRAAARWRPLDV